jgi:trans-aconitate 2-methyltransferase
MSGEWNAASYHRVSNPHVNWGIAVLEQLPLAGDELVIDLGCGTGRLTEKILERLPRGRVIGIDRSVNMTRAANDHFKPRFASRINVVLADAVALPIAGAADAVFSTATFHWIASHEALFASIFTALKPGGRLVAQSGGGPNLARVHERCERLMALPRFRAYFTEWEEPWHLADAARTAERLTGAGFVDVRTSLEPSPVTFEDAASFAEFITTVICRPYVACLTDPDARDAFIGDITRQAADDHPPFELDYWRLNLSGRKPREHAIDHDTGKPEVVDGVA